MIDILLLTWNRAAFTAECVHALRANTDWSQVGSLIIYDDCSTDGAFELAALFTEGSDVFGPAPIRQSFVIHPERHVGSPVELMQRYISGRHGLPMPSPWFVKLDNDAILPPGWLEEGLDVLKRHPDVDLLGIEPGVGPLPLSTRAMCGADWDERPKGTCRGIVPADFIGGIGFMRRSIFRASYAEGGRAPLVGAGRFGWQHWQERYREVKKAWIAPGLPVILLNRMYTEPWATLSRSYVSKGWQRKFPGDYKPEDKHIWEWWKHGER